VISANYSAAMPGFFKPLSLAINPFLHATPQGFIAVAGNDIQVGAQVYLLYEIPTAFLAKNFKRGNECTKISIPVSRLNNLYFSYHVQIDMVIIMN
jgi:hypothetical protein